MQKLHVRKLGGLNPAKYESNWIISPSFSLENTQMLWNKHLENTYGKLYGCPIWSPIDSSPDVVEDFSGPHLAYTLSTTKSNREETTVLARMKPTLDIQRLHHKVQILFGWGLDVSWGVIWSMAVSKNTQSFLWKCLIFLDFLQII